MIELLKSFECHCEVVTDAYIKERPAAYETSWRSFEELFRHLYLFSCCHWGCHGKEHVLEHLAGKTVTNASVATRAMFHGYYDESLALIRNIGEIANLVNLFWFDSDKIRQWIDSDEKARRKKFTPSGIRKMLEKNETMIPFENAHYSFLCETAVHPVPHVIPQYLWQQRATGTGVSVPGEGVSTDLLEFAMGNIRRLRSDCKDGIT